MVAPCVPGSCGPGLVCCSADGTCRKAAACHWGANRDEDEHEDTVRPPAACPSCPARYPPPFPPDIEDVPRGLPCGPDVDRTCPWVFGGDLCCAAVPSGDGRRLASCVPCDRVKATGHWYWAQPSGWTLSR